jgi:hypothetical protein
MISFVQCAEQLSSLNVSQMYGFPAVHLVTLCRIDVCAALSLETRFKRCVGHDPLLVVRVSPHFP